MLRRKKIAIVLMALLCIGNSGVTQAATSWEWEIKPTYPSDNSVIDIPPTLSFREGLAAIQVGEKYGYIDEAFNMIIPATFDVASEFNEAGVARVTDEYWRGSIDKKGKYIVEPEYDYFSHYAEGLAIVSYRSRWNGYIDYDGKRVIEEECSVAMPFSEGLAEIFDNGRHYYIDRAGEEVITLPEGVGGGSFNNGYAYTYKEREGNKGTLYGLIDKKGNPVLNVEYTYIGLPEGAGGSLAGLGTPGYYIMGKGAKKGVFETEEMGVYSIKDKKFIIPMQKASIIPIGEGYFSVAKGDKQYLYNTLGKCMTPLGYQKEWEYPYSEGLVCVKQNGKYGFVDTTGKEVIPCTYEAVSKTFAGGYVGFKANNQYGLLNKQNQVVILPMYDELIPLENGLSIVSLKGKSGVINAKNEFVIPMAYSKIKYSDRACFIVEKNGKWGIINSQGKILVPVQFENATSRYMDQLNNEKYFWAKQNGLWGVVKVKE